MDEGIIVELKRNSAEFSRVVEDVVTMEKNIFPEHESSRSFNEKFLDQELSKENFGLLYVRVNGEVAGYAMYDCRSSLLSLIVELAVKETYRRRGYGEALLKTAISKCQARNIQRITLHVDPSRTEALRLYKKLGFRIYSLVEKYYSADRDAYELCLDLYVNE